MNTQSFIVVLLLSLFVCPKVETLGKHRRTCCKYSENATCKDSKGCILEQSGKTTSPSVEQCKVLGDSKKDISTLASKEKCMSQNYESPVSSETVADMFHIKRYLMEADSPQKEFIVSIFYLRLKMKGASSSRFEYQFFRFHKELSSKTLSFVLFQSLEIHFPLTHDWYFVNFRVFNMELCSSKLSFPGLKKFANLASL